MSKTYVGKMLQGARKAQGLSASSIEISSGIKRNAQWRFESGNRVPPSARSVIALATAYNIPFRKLLHAYCQDTLNAIAKECKESNGRTFAISPDIAEIKYD